MLQSNTKTNTNVNKNIYLLKSRLGCIFVHYIFKKRYLLEEIAVINWGRFELRKL